jgi:hypothetical protein
MRESTYLFQFETEAPYETLHAGQTEDPRDQPSNDQICIVLPCPRTSGVEAARLPSSRPQPSDARYLHTPTTLRRRQSSDARSLHTPTTLRRPPSSHARHSSHTPRPGSDDSSHTFSYSKWRYLLVVVVVVEEEEEEMKSFTGYCPLEDLPRVCTPSHHRPLSRILTENLRYSVDPLQGLVIRNALRDI